MNPRFDSWKWVHFTSFLLLPLLAPAPFDCRYAEVKADEHDHSDGLIVNLGKPEYLDQPPPHPKQLERWHCDGDVRPSLCRKRRTDHYLVDSVLSSCKLQNHRQT